MARPKSPEKREAILAAAAQEIAESGLSVATARIARRANIAEGTLFTYFATKDELLNALYLELKRETYEHVQQGFPVKDSLEQRTRHVWSSYIAWVLGSPAKRRAMAQLNVSDLITASTRAQAAAGRDEVERMLSELNHRTTLRNLPKGFAAVLMLSMQEAILEFVSKAPSTAKKKQLIESGFTTFWRAIS
ncbi:TetR family transcriptional regulator [Granulicella sp. 5B5]|uniref:TetR/AcrR family transcriptional regulator n=1 Tax=Granulicella sp. 5B5 TaxID=1617967 RepID=UPI0015F6DD34|nr:TetR/AcrR family transcriptional regulator [Granulicella sp. 5B5]QMV18293.1 TetR family transcriptional regulator [Granulicella sp. 5B5]